MSSEQSYYTTKEFKAYKKINDIQDDEKLDRIERTVNASINTRLAPYAESFPLSSTSLTAVKSAAFNLFLSLWQKEQNDFEAAKIYKSDFETEMTAAIMAIKSIPTPRTKIVASSQVYDTETPIHSQFSPLDL